MKWIDVNDRLPKEGRTVLVEGGVAKYYDGAWYTGMDVPIFRRRIEWEVTHWMPLPALPTSINSREPGGNRPKLCAHKWTAKAEFIEWCSECGAIKYLRVNGNKDVEVIEFPQTRTASAR